MTNKSSRQIFFRREVYSDKLESLSGKTDIIKIITGVRRCGKSSLLSYFKSSLETKTNNIISINLEDLLQVREIGLIYNDKNFLVDYNKMLDFILKKINKNKINYLIIDEVQLLEGWEKIVNTLRLQGNIDIYLTGSNAYMFSSDIANALGGRYIEIKMLPYSFKEYYIAYNETTKFISLNKEDYLNRNDSFSLYKKYITESSFPQTVSFLGNRQLINDYLNDTIYTSTLQKDIIKRYNISNVDKLDALTRFLFDNIGNETSIRGIEKSLKNTPQNLSAMTITNYLNGLLDSYLLYKCDRFDIKGKQILTNTNSKYYMVDLGLRSALLGYKEGDHGRILENIVYLELLRRGYKVYVGRINNRSNIEVDFVAQKEGLTEYYQVAFYTYNSKETLERELRSLNSIDDNYPKYLLTMDEDDGNIKGIKRLNVLDWLFDK